MRYLSSKGKSEGSSDPHELINQPITGNLNTDQNNLEVILQNCSDLVLKRFQFGNPPFEGLLLYFDGLVDRQEVEFNLLKPLMLEMDMLRNQDGTLQEDVLESVRYRIVTMAEIKTVTDYNSICHHISSGDAVFLIDGIKEALVAGTRSWEGRGVERPENEVVVYGPKESFTETVRFNTAMIRRRIKSANLKIEGYIMGRVTKTDVVLCYISGIAPPNLINEIRSRLASIDTDAVLDPEYLQEFIADTQNTIFAQVEHTEKPDRVCGHLLEGRAAIIVDGSPTAMILPVSFPQFWIAAEDYYTPFIPASLYRIGRFTAFLLALLLPSLYVAITSYHQEMLPTALYLTIAAARQGVPFPIFVEAFLMEATFELLREAGLRLPRAVGPAVSIVGALIIGDAAVRAGLVSTPMVVIVAFTGIASFVAPNYNAALIIRIARFGFLAAAAALGFLGIMVVLILMLVRMASLSSLGMPYLSPIAPFNWTQLSDIILRRHWKMANQRPYMEGMENQVRQKSGEGNA
ncbi:MAG TPA: spore germination protein [Syntrophomonadaceae bacterium]|nr:spore germination protein [Syntrophomonadaceae bacterium]